MITTGTWTYRLLRVGSSWWGPTGRTGRGATGLAWNVPALIDWLDPRPPAYRNEAGSVDGTRLAPSRPT